MTIKNCTFETTEPGLGVRVDNSGSDFSDVKVGDRLWLRTDCYSGWAYVTDKKVNATYPIVFEYDNNGLQYRACITLSGCAQPNGPQVLFWDRVEIVPPPRPKRKIAQILTRSEIENIEKRQNLNPERVDLPSETMALIVDTLLYYTTPEEVPYPEPKRLVKKTIQMRPYSSIANGSFNLMSYSFNDPDILWSGPIQTVTIEVEEND